LTFDGWVVLHRADLGTGHQPSEWEQILGVETPDVYHTSPDPDDLQYTSKGFKTAMCDHYENGLRITPALPEPRS
jgi:hypothetical protein